MGHFPLLSQDIAELEALMSPTRNHEGYRSAMASCSGFCVPYLAVFLKDLMSTENAYAHSPFLVVVVVVFFFEHDNCLIFFVFSSMPQLRGHRW